MLRLKNTLFLLAFGCTRLFGQDDSAHKAEFSAHAPVKGTFKDIQADKIYRMKYAIDVPVTVVFGAGSIYAMTVIYSKPATPVNDILKLDKNKIPAIDRWEAGVHDANMDKVSYYPFYAVMPLPLLFLADKAIAKDKGRVGLLYLEAFAFEGILYTGAVYFADRFRPDVYNASLDLDYRTNGNFRNSFFAGHVAVVANTTFFMSTVYMDYHPGSRLKWWLYGASAAATLGMSYMRLEAGKHFPTDIFAGIAVGTACGILTPALHRNIDVRAQRWGLTPFIGTQNGFTFSYKL